MDKNAGIRLSMAFGLLVTILVGVGSLGLSQMRQSNVDLNDIYYGHWTKVQLAREAIFYSNLNDDLLTEVILVNHKEDIDQLLSLRDENVRRITAIVNQIGARLDSPEEKALIARVTEAKDPAVLSFRRALDLANRQKKSEARQVMVADAMPRIIALHEAWNQFAQFEENQMLQARNQSQAKYAAAHRLSLLLVFTAIAVAIGIAIVVTRRMVREIRQHENSKLEVRKLNAALEKKVSERTEELAGAVHELQSEINERRRSEAKFRSLVENSPYGILRVAADGRILQANRAVVGMLGYKSEEEILGLNMASDVFRDPADRRRVIEEFQTQSNVRGVEVEWKRKDGKAIAVRFARHTVRSDDGNIDYKELVVEDITERRALELQLRQSQKMEAVGCLAGGVAHDFNNLLGVIIGYSELLLDRLAESDPLRRHADEIKKAGDRASSLTRQLLAFSRQQVLELKILNLNTVIVEMEKLLARLIGEDVELYTSLDPNLGQIKADQGQIDQVIMNLAVNARDAMPEGGKLIIETRNVDVSTDYAQRHPPMLPGEYVLLEVSDTGVGMDAQTQARIFEPFFTTKPSGKGTGLGLSTVYGIVKQSDGFVWVYSEEQLGTTFKIYLPRLDAKPLPPPTDLMALPGRKSETILLVEDEESLRTLTCTLLEQAGYKVLEANGGDQAIEIARHHRGPIHLLLTDVVMPGMNGCAVAEGVGLLHPQIKVVYMSGYAGLNQRELFEAEAVFVTKPFRREVLLGKLRDALALDEKAQRT
jgi:PAS domain S-box-containing protein